MRLWILGVVAAWLGVMSACGEGGPESTEHAPRPSVHPPSAVEPVTPPPILPLTPAEVQVETPQKLTLWVVRPDGYGPVRVGMTVAEASAALGAPVNQPGGSHGTCRYVFPPGGPGAATSSAAGPPPSPAVALMVVEQRVVRVDVTDLPYTTSRGVHVDSRLDEVLAAYPGQTSIERNKSDDRWKNVVVKPPGPGEESYRLVFEIDEEGRVRAFRAGRLPEVAWTERCG